MSEPADQVDEFEGAIVLERSFSILIRNIVPIGLVSLIVMSPPYIILIVSNGIEFAALLSFLISPLLSYFVAALLSVMIVQILQGQPAILFQSVGRGVQAIFPVTLVALVAGSIWGVMTYGEFAWIVTSFSTSIWGSARLGVLSIISIPVVTIFGLYLLSLFWFAIPAAVLESPFQFDLGRSVVLSKGYRKVACIFLVLVIILNAAAHFIPVIASMGEYASIAFSWVAASLVMAFSAIMANVSYYRRCRVESSIKASEQGAARDLPAPRG